MSGLFSLARELFLAYRSAIGQPVTGSASLASFAHLSLAAFIVCMVATWWLEHQTVVELERERRQEDPAVTMRRQQFYVEPGKLNATHLPLLHYVVRCGGRDGSQVQLFLREHGIERDRTQIDTVLGEVVRLTGFLALEGWSLTAGYGIYSVNESWKPQLEEWAASTGDSLPRHGGPRVE